MPWKETAAVIERMRFVLEHAEAEESMASLCRMYGISRKVGYKWIRRYQQLGIDGLKDQSRAPLNHPHALKAALEQRLLQLRGQHPTWGPRKLRVLLQREEPERVPAASTIGQVLQRAGLIVPRKRRRRTPPHTRPLDHASEANRVWCVDYKGWFRVGDGRRCDPLTISDGYSRYLLKCQVMKDPGCEASRRVFEAAFREYGLPVAIRSDNGQPFAGVGVGGLSRLSVWWVRLGIRPERIEPAKPQQNGRHERMHLTLKQQTAMPAAADLRAQQERFDRFREEYNQVRPHEALGMAVPAALYEPSPRPYPHRLGELEYPSGWALRRVGDRGEIRWRVQRVLVGRALEGQVVGLEALDERYWRMWFGPVELGVMDGRQHRLLRRCERRRLGF